ncbi:MAG: peptide ABC transporter permease [Candidatus Rokuibacteriota bacterium]|nr:MAG: peptide ABC transporter permease [Candidatus Rokubacteria bacterium]PYN55879.1 MAG: peptide ABC transporter permease [Candidatus Rokubacteria bacterium]
MATIPIGADRTLAAVRAARRGYRVLRGLPIVPLAILALLAAVAVLAPVLAPHGKLDPVKPTREQCLAKYSTPDCPYVDNAPPFWAAGGRLDTPLGTDSLGRDELSRLMHGARISLIVALTGTLFAGAIGTLLGVLAGYMGRWWDEIIMRITDAWLTLPSLVFAILLSSVREPGLWNVVLILALVFWSRYSRAVRGEVLALRERDFVKLAEINGIGKLTIIWRHLIPNVMNTVMVLFSLQVGVAVIIEASLSFLGFGVPPPEPSWGLMMAQERESLMEGRWWLEVFPGACITMLVLSANMLGDWLRVHLDPQLRNR